MRLVGELRLPPGRVGYRGQHASPHGSLEGSAVSAWDGHRVREGRQRIPVHRDFRVHRRDEGGVGGGAGGERRVVVVAPPVEVPGLPWRGSPLVGERPGLRSGIPAGDGHTVEAELTVAGVDALGQGPLTDEGPMRVPHLDLREPVAAGDGGGHPCEDHVSPRKGYLRRVRRLTVLRLRSDHREGVPLGELQGAGVDWHDVAGGGGRVDVGRLHRGFAAEAGADDRCGVGHLPGHAVNHRQGVAEAGIRRLGNGLEVLEGDGPSRGARGDGAYLP